MTKQKSPLKNGIELAFLMQIVVELTEQYPVKREVKMTSNKFKQACEKYLDKEYANIYNLSPEMTINVHKKLEKLSQIVAKLDVSEMVLFSDFAERFYNNKHIATEKGLSFFEKILL